MKSFNELVKATSLLDHESRVYLETFIEKLQRDLARRKRIQELIVESLSQLKLDLMYLNFDLECTRQERDKYKREVGDV